MNITNRPVGQRQPRLEMPSLRKSAEFAPMCFYCLRPNYDKTCVLAHNNWLDAGKGIGVKTHDILGAIVCGEPGGCHDLIDGRVGDLSVEERKEMHGRAHRATLVWWCNESYVRVA